MRNPGSGPTYRAVGTSLVRGHWAGRSMLQQRRSSRTDTSCRYQGWSLPYPETLGQIMGAVTSSDVYLMHVPALRGRVPQDIQTQSICHTTPGANVEGGAKKVRASKGKHT